MSKITKGKIIKETNRITDQANKFEFKPWHIVVGAVAVLFAVYGAGKALGVW